MRLLLVQTGFFGDLILSTPVLEGLVAAFPGAEISVLTTPQSAVLLSGDVRLRSVMAFDKRGREGGLRGLIRFAKRLRAEAFDAAFSLHKSYRTALLLRLAGIPLRFGFTESALSFLYSARASRRNLPHEVLRNLTLFEAAGLPPAELEGPLRLVLNAAARQAAAELLQGMPDKIVGIAPGSVWATKRWNADGFAAAARALVESGYAVVLIGGPSDMRTAEEIQEKAGVDVRNLAGKADLLTSAALVERFSVLVTNDSAPLHMASAVGTPCVAVFCATVPEFGYGPWRVAHRIVEVPGLDCRPCGRHGGRRCPTGTQACSLQINPSVVVGAALELAAAKAAEDRHE